MKVSYNWLKEYIDITLDPGKLAHLLTMAGVNVASWHRIEGDYIFEFEITANRPDCLSIIGIAREISAVLEKKLKVPKEIQKGRKIKLTNKENLPISVKIKDPDLCYRYSARIIKDVEVKESPDWLKERIISAGLRPVNNIVDITNFVLFETGQPMHAFDLDKIKGDILIRRAKKGEKIIGIDSVPRACDEDMLLIADSENPIAIAGVMGGLDTEVGNMTKNILLESAFFNPISVRRTSRTLGLSSESSYRFERKIDNGMVLKASERVSDLIDMIAGGKKGPIIDIGNKKSYSKSITLNLQKCESLLGVSVTKKKASKILKSLEFDINEKKGSIRAIVPSFREDVKNEIDLTEEIARIYGYEKIPLTIPRIVGNTSIKDFSDVVEDKIKQILTRLGLKEIITYSLINKNRINGLGIKDDIVVALKNPLSIDQEIMRPTLLPGMLGVISYNLNRRAKHLSLFEIGKMYTEKKHSYQEEVVLSLGLAGIKRETWKVQKEEFDFFDVKGIFETLLGELGLDKIFFKRDKAERFNSDVSAAIEYEGEIIARLGEVNKKILGSFDIEKKVFYGELYIRKILKKINLNKRYLVLGRYPSVTRDISVVAEKKVTSSAITDIINDIGKALVKNVDLIDCYKGKQISQEKRGLLYRIEYRSDERTLEDAEVDKLHTLIKDALTQKLGISFR